DDGSKVRRERVGFARPLERRGRTRFVTSEEAQKLFPPVYEALRRQRPGVPARSDKGGELRQTRMPDEGASTPRRFVVLELDGEVQAYAIYRLHGSFEDGVSTARLEV